MDLPKICEECLGEEQNIKMYKYRVGNRCRKCKNVFDTYRWRKNGKSYYTKICISCCISCQCCDLNKF